MLHNPLPPKEACAKIQRYCAFQERSHYEVKEKLYSYGLRKQEVEAILAELIADNFLNEERFATAFAGGKFRMKQWGRIKIKYALQQKKVSNYNINKALEMIDEENYEQVLQKLANKKWRQVKTEQPFLKKAKTFQYLLQKGYEKHLVKIAVDKASLSNKA